MKKKTIIIVAGGDLFLKLLPEIKKGDYIIGADYGAYWLLFHGVTPDEAIGDFDSVSKEELQLIEECIPMVSKYPKEKDYTDLELALERAIQMKPKEIVIFGATGGRLDHTLGACLLLEKFSDSGIFIRCVDVSSEITLVTNTLTINKDKKHQYCSLFSLTEKSIVSLYGFYYSLDKGILKRGSTTGVSNELVKKKGQIAVHRGTLLCIKSSDININ